MRFKSDTERSRTPGVSLLFLHLNTGVKELYVDRTGDGRNNILEYNGSNFVVVPSFEGINVRVIYN